MVRDVTSGLAEFLRMAPPGVAIWRSPRPCSAAPYRRLAVHVLALGGSAVGWLTAAFGAGGLAGGAVATGAVRITGSAGFVPDAGSAPGFLALTWRRPRLPGSGRGRDQECGRHSPPLPW